MCSTYLHPVSEPVGLSPTVLLSFIFVPPPIWRVPSVIFEELPGEIITPSMRLLHQPKRVTKASKGGKKRSPGSDFRRAGGGWYIKEPVPCLV